LTVAVISQRALRRGYAHRSKAPNRAGKKQYRMKFLPAEGTGAAFNLLDFGTSCRQLAARNYTISRATERAGDFRLWQILLQKSKIEKRQKSRECCFLASSIVAMLHSASLTFPRTNRISGLYNFRSSPAKDFFNTIGP